jgi:hypothetical protein
MSSFFLPFLFSLGAVTFFKMKGSADEAETD